MAVVKFFCNAQGKEPVRSWLKGLDLADRKKIGVDLQKVQLGWDKGLIREPLVKNLKGGLWELRTSLASHKIARVIFCFSHKDIVLLHGFIKKTQRVFLLDLSLAKLRKKAL